MPETTKQVVIALFNPGKTLRSGNRSLGPERSELYLLVLYILLGSSFQTVHKPRVTLVSGGFCFRLIRLLAVYKSVSPLYMCRSACSSRMECFLFQ